MTTRRQFLRLAGPAHDRRCPHAPGRRAQASQAHPGDDSVLGRQLLDIVGRIVLDPLSSQLGQPIVVENRGGAGGPSAPPWSPADPDGYTILINAPAHSAAPPPIRM